MSSRTRRRFTTEKKAQIVRRHLGDKAAVSELADEMSLPSSQIHTWVRQVLDRFTALRGLRGPVGQAGHRLRQHCV